MHKTLTFSVFYNSPDYDTALPFYRDVMGWAVKDIYEHPGRRGVIFIVRPGVEFELIGLSADQPRPHPPPQGMRLRLEVADRAACEAEHTRLSQAGVEVIQPVTRQPWGEVSFGIRTPDGLPIYIYADD